jgi:hypothetical protein
MLCCSTDKRESTSLQRAFVLWTRYQDLGPSHLHFHGRERELGRGMAVHSHKFRIQKSVDPGCYPRLIGGFLIIRRQPLRVVDAVSQSVLIMLLVENGTSCKILDSLLLKVSVRSKRFQTPSTITVALWMSLRIALIHQKDYVSNVCLDLGQFLTGHPYCFLFFRCVFSSTQCPTDRVFLMIEPNLSWCRHYLRCSCGNFDLRWIFTICYDHEGHVITCCTHPPEGGVNECWD